jgi:hypothetical protein
MYEWKNLEHETSTKGGEKRERFRDFRGAFVGFMFRRFWGLEQCWVSGWAAEDEVVGRFRPQPQPTIKTVERANLSYELLDKRWVYMQTQPANIPGWSTPSTSLLKSGRLSGWVIPLSRHGAHSWTNKKALHTVVWPVVFAVKIKIVLVAGMLVAKIRSGVNLLIAAGKKA